MPLRFVLLPFAILLTAACVRAQSIAVYGLDSSAFPILSAKLIAFDSTDRRMPVPGSVTVRERGMERQVLEITGCDDAAATPLSVSVVLNVRRHMDRAVAFLRRLITSLPTPESEMSIAAGDREMIVLRNMTRDRASLLATVDALPPLGGAWPGVLLNDSIAGGYAMLAGCANRKIVVIVTETDPSVSHSDYLHIMPDSAGALFVVYVGNNGTGIGNGPTGMHREHSSGAVPGWMRADVHDPRAAEQVAACVIAEASGNACRFRWQTEPACASDSIPLAVTAPVLDLSTSLRYVPSHLGARIDASPIPPFSDVPPGATMEFTDTLRAVAASFDIGAITTSDPRFMVVPGSLPPLPLHLAVGASCAIRLRYAPADSSLAIATLDVDAGACSFGFPLSGGFHGHGVHWPSLKLTSLNGGAYIRGTWVLVTWAGIPNRAAVRLEYSEDGGTSWTLITQEASGGQYYWHTPPHAIARCLLRATAVENANAGADVVAVDGGVMGSGFSYDGSFIAVSLFYPAARVRVIDRHTGASLREFPRKLFDNGYTYQERMRWSPRDHRLMTWFRANGDGSGVEIWNADSGVLTRELRLPDPLTLDSATWSGDARRIAMICHDKYNGRAVALWDVGTGAQLAHLPVENCPVIWSPDGSYLLAVEPGTNLRTVMLIDGYSGTVLRRFNADSIGLLTSTDCLAYAMRPDNARIILSSSRNEPSRVVDVETGRPFPVILFEHMSAPGWSPDGTRFQGKFPSAWKIYNAETLTELCSLPQTSGLFGWSPDGRFVAVTDGRNLHTYDATTGVELRALRSALDQYDPAVAWAPDGRALSFRLERNRSAIWFLDGGAPTAADTSDAPFSLIEPAISYGPKSVHMGAVRSAVGYADTVLPAAVCNNSPIPVPLTVELYNGDYSGFVMIDGAGSFTLSPGTCRDFTVAFVPSSDRTHSVGATALLPANQALWISAMDGVGVGPFTTLHAGEIDYGAAMVGTAHDTVVRLTLSNSNDTALTVRRISSIGPDAAAFEILSPQAPFTLGPKDSITVRARFTPTGSGRMVTRFLFDVDDGAEPFRLRLSGIGADGKGPVAEGNAATIAINPNIVHTSAVVRFASGAEGRATLELYDLLGRRLATLADESMTAGVHAVPLDTEGLASGMYIVRLRTPVGDASARVQVYR